MELLGKIGFAIVKWKSRRGLRGAAKAGAVADAKKEALRVGVNGETYAYWYLRSLGYVFIARNYEPSHAKGELDLVGFDGETLAFVGVRTRELTSGKAALPELSITRGKHKVLIRTAHYFLRERHIGGCPMRFDWWPSIMRPGGCRWFGCTETRSVHAHNPAKLASIIIQTRYNYGL
jgi:putative endonuclease